MNTALIGYVRIYDPVGLLEKSKELRKLQQQIDDLMDRIIELREERKFYQRPARKRRRKLVAREG